MHGGINYAQIVRNYCGILILGIISAYGLTVPEDDDYLLAVDSFPFDDRYANEPDYPMRLQTLRDSSYISPYWKELQSDPKSIQSKSINPAYKWMEQSMQKRINWLEAAHRYKKIPEDEMWAAPIVPGEPSDLRKPRRFDRSGYIADDNWHNEAELRDRPLASPKEDSRKKRVEPETNVPASWSKLHNESKTDRFTAEKEKSRAIAQRRLRQLAALLHHWRA